MINTTSPFDSFTYWLAVANRFRCEGEDLLADRVIELLLLRGTQDAQQ